MSIKIAHTSEYILFVILVRQCGISWFSKAHIGTEGASIGDWNRKHKKFKTICSRVDVFKNLTEMDIFCFESAAIIAVYQIFHLID